MKEYVAYEGPCFTIEWFYNEQGESQALEYFNGLSDVQKRKVLMLLSGLAISEGSRILRNSGTKATRFSHSSRSQTDFFRSFIRAIK